MLRVGIAGYGIVGKRRRECVDRHPKMKVVAVCDRGFSGNGLMEDGLRFFKNYQVNNKVMQLAKKNAIFMHCLPAHRGEEVSNDVIDGYQSVVWQQAINRIYVQQAVLSYIFNKR